MACNRPVPYAQVIDGHRRCPLASPESVRNGLRFEAQRGDLVELSYPRSGTHWVQYIIQLIINEGAPYNTYEEFSMRAQFLEYHADAAQRQTSASLRTLMTHLPLDLEKLNPEAKYVYVARNPWDVCVSLYHQITSMSHYQFQDGTFDDLLEAFLEGSLPYGCYFEHVVAGYSLKNEPNVLFLTYEELQGNVRDGVLRLANFIGEHYGTALQERRVEGKKLLDVIMERCSVESMRNVMVFNLSDHPDPVVNEQLKKLNITTTAPHEGDTKRHAFVRNGKTGEWKEHFSPAQLRRMEDVIKKKTIGSKVMDLWSDIRAEAMRMSEEN